MIGTVGGAETTARGHFRDVLRLGATAFFVKGLGVGLGHLFNLVLARLLGADGAGLYFVSLATLTVASTIARLGLDQALLRTTAAHRGEGDWSRIAGQRRSTLRVVTAASVAIAAILAGAAPWLARAVFGRVGLSVPLVLMSAALLPVTLLSVYVELLKALERVREAVFLETAGVPLLALPLLWLAAHRWGVSGACFAFLVANLILLSAAIAFWRSWTPRAAPEKGSQSAPVGPLVASGLPFLTIAATNMISTAVPTLLLGAWSGAAAAGVYVVAERLAASVQSLLSAVNSILPAKFAALHRRGERETLMWLARRTALVTTLLASPILLAALLIPGWILGLFGPQFRVGSLAFSLLTLAQFFSVACGSVGPLLMMTRHERALRTIMLAAFGGQIILDVMLIPRFGLTGAAIATLCYLVSANVASLVVVRVSRRAGNL